MLRYSPVLILIKCRLILKVLNLKLSGIWAI